MFGVIANVLYDFLPLFNVEECLRKRKSAHDQIYDPCGAIIRSSWYPYDATKFPLFHFAFFVQMYACFSSSITVLSVSTVLIGFLMYIIGFLKHCREEIRKSFRDSTSSEMLRARLVFCVRYHNSILRYVYKLTT